MNMNMKRIKGLTQGIKNLGCVLDLAYTVSEHSYKLSFNERGSGLDEF
jgi:hypothetical protein